MSELSGGTLTVLYTKIEVSTLLTMHLGDRYPEVLATHCTLAQAAVTAHEGYEVDTQGDSFFVVFPRATQTVAAAVALHRALAAAAWPEGWTVRVRIGLHTGEPIRTTTGYTGLDVIRGARIRDTGHGGQVLLSKSPAALVVDVAESPVERPQKNSAATTAARRSVTPRKPSLSSRNRPARASASPSARGGSTMSNCASGAESP